MPIEESTAAKLTVPEIRDAYSRLAPLYGIWETLTEGKARRLAIKAAGVHDGERLLEVGVGLGSAFEQMLRKNSRGVNIGADLSASMLSRAAGRIRRSLLPGATLCECDARLLPFEAGSFDLVYSAHLLDLLAIADIEIAMSEMRRVLKPSGRLVLVHLSNRNRWFNFLWNLLYWGIPYLVGGCRPIRVASHLPKLGFTMVEVHRATQMGIPWDVLAAVRDDVPDRSPASERASNEGVPRQSN